ncbi:N-glycosylase/DNA lyase [Candidatus Gracilibacteria bacterium]|nr:N-glycosylase/DNA lyase [Candidatus Gracilibacteria bacterium]
METLLKTLKNYSIDDCYAIEEQSKEFANLSIIFNKIDNKEFFLPLVLASGIVFYSLSNTGDTYWEKVGENIESFNNKKLA